MTENFKNNTVLKNEKILSLTPYIFAQDPYPLLFTKSEEPFLYTIIKKRVFFYRMIFLFLGSLFAILAGMLFFHLPNWNFHVVFGGGLPLKVFFSFLAFTLCIASLWIACTLRTTIEAMTFLARDCKRRLKKIYLNHPMNLEIEKKYASALQEVKAEVAHSIRLYENLENKPLSDKKRKALAIDLIVTLKNRLSYVVRDFN